MQSRWCVHDNESGTIVVVIEDIVRKSLNVHKSQENEDGAVYMADNIFGNE